MCPGVCSTLSAPPPVTERVSPSARSCSGAPLGLGVYESDWREVRSAESCAFGGVSGILWIRDDHGSDHRQAGEETVEVRIIDGLQKSVA